jgi:hypothetical protein
MQYRQSPNDHLTDYFPALQRTNAQIAQVGD